MEETVVNNKRLCGCGCGTEIAAFDKWHNRPRRFVTGHGNRGKKFTKIEKYEMLCSKCGNKTSQNTIGNPIWYHRENGDPICRSCWDKERYWNDLEYVRARGVSYRERNREKNLAYWKKYREEHREVINKKRVKYYYKHRTSEIDKRKTHRKNFGSTSVRIRRKIVDMLGGKCVECGYDINIRALCLDHKDGKGSADRKTFGRLIEYYRFYLNNPEVAKQKLQVMCYNCNAIKMDLKQEYWMGGTFPRRTVTTTL